jgi:Mrp family chromosome partitioning ATPase/capsular polysaccharide biosynthesis protein
MNQTTDATAIFAPIWRRKWLILAVAIIVAAASYVYFRRERPTYQTSTQVYLGAAAEEQALTEHASKARSSALSDQASVINTIVVEQVRQMLRAKHKAGLARGKVKAKVPEKSEFITITAEGHSARGVATLANLTAQTYIKRQRQKRRRGTEAAIAVTRRQLRRIEQAALAKAEQPARRAGATSGKSSGAATTAPSGTGESAASVIQEATLSAKINQLEASLGSATAQQVKPAKAANALLLSPKPRQDAIFGFVLGLVLASIAAYAFTRFDRRLRSLAAIEALFGLPLLSAMPKVRRPIVRATGHPPRPSANLLEPLRRLQAAAQLSDRSDASLGAPASRVILFVSPDPGDGKSTIAADLALVQRDAGERVVLVEANFRRPVLGRMLALEGEGRLADVLAGRLDIDEALQRVPPAAPAEYAPLEPRGGAVTTAVQAGVGSLFVLGGGRSVANPPALLAQRSVGELLRSLADRFDSIVIDAPSPLEVSDVLPLLGIVERIVVVARAGHSREASAQRLRELLEAPSCAPVLGVVANFVSPADVRRYGFSSVNGRVWPGGGLTGR